MVPVVSWSPGHLHVDMDSCYHSRTDASVYCTHCFLMVARQPFFCPKRLLSPPGFGGGGFAVGGERGLGGTVDFGCDFPSDDFPVPFSPFFCGVPFWCIDSICLAW